MRKNLWALIGALSFGCGGATFSISDQDAGPDASTSGTSATSSATTGSSVTSGSSTGAATGMGGAGGTGGAGGAGGTGVDAGIDWSQCSGAGQCIAQIKGCCLPCAMPTVDNFAGVNSKYTDAFRAETCPVPTPCPKCAAFGNPYIGARCESSHCQAFDTRLVPEFSKCAVDTDCRLRKGLDCCECGSQGSWTAVSIAGQSALSAAECAPMTGCADCLPVPPDGMKAICNMGHCEIAP